MTAAVAAARLAQQTVYEEKMAALQSSITEQRQTVELLTSVFLAFLQSSLFLQFIQFGFRCMWPLQCMLVIFLFSAKNCLGAASGMRNFMNCAIFHSSSLLCWEEQILNRTRSYHNHKILLQLVEVYEISQCHSQYALCQIGNHCMDHVLRENLFLCAIKEFEPERGLCQGTEGRALFCNKEASRITEN